MVEEPAVLGGHDGAGAERAGDQHDRGHGQAQHRLVGHQLGAGPNRTEQRILGSRRPARQHHAVDRDARHHQQEEDPPGRVGQLQAGGVPGDGDGAADGHDGEHQQGREQHQVGRGPVDELVGAPGRERLLEEQLGAVGEGLEPAVGAGPVGAVAHAELGHRLALVHDHEEHGDHHDGEDRHHLDEEDDPDGQVEAVVEDRITHPRHLPPGTGSSRDLGERGAGVDQIAGAGARQVPGQQRRSGRQGRVTGAGSTSAPRAELTRTASPSAAPMAASTDGCTARRAGGCSPARAGTACTWVPPSQRVRRRHQAEGAGSPAAGRAAGAAGGGAAGRPSHGRHLRPGAPRRLACRRPRPARPARRSRPASAAAGGPAPSGFGPGRHRGVEHGGRAPRRAAPPRRSPGRPSGSSGLRVGRRGAGVRTRRRHDARRRGPASRPAPRGSRPDAGARPGRPRSRCRRGWRSRGRPRAGWPARWRSPSRARPRRGR